MIGKVSYVGSLDGLPEFTYTGRYTLQDDGDKNWRIKFLSSGTLKFTKLGTGKGSIDVFCVGGGAGYVRGNGWDEYGYYYPKSFGGGGYTTTKTTTISKGVDIPVVVGAKSANASTGGTVAEAGASTFNGTITAKGGASHGPYKGGNGGSGGAGFDTHEGSSFAGGTNGGNGSGAVGAASQGGGSGQGTTTREFGEPNGTLYSSGGGSNITSAVANSGNGGTDTISAQDGIVIIRNHR